MFDTLIALHTLELIRSSLEQIEKRCSDIHSTDDFLLSDTGMMKLDSICMKLTAVGESIKNLDKITNKELLVKYPEIPWKNVMGIRDIIVHHYFDVDADEIFRICKEDLPQLYEIIIRMINEMK
ncbi:HepT-like ribonuclease domain-containing protein [uncultured Bacteroides sp.]|uniref:HepT-like ribonuclease domain-containing protein n=1 Tax=uncultured Bacteroides sp. TaxID=162156 RepID=UPI00258F28B3|nr:HepT-like ribonuclease domain-containing protein [uncultured Bacteroides sp.]